MPFIIMELLRERQATLRLEAFPAAAHDRLLQRITARTAELEGRVEAAAPHRSGKLVSRIRSRVYDDVTRITGRVFVDGDYGKAAALEYGAHGAAKPRPHQMRLDHIFARKIPPIEVMVKAYSRQLDLAARRFLRGPLAAMSTEAVADMRAALDDAVEQG